MPPTRIKAIVLKRTDFRETSVIVNLLTDSIGKITGLMKGVRSSARKVPPLAFQQGVCIEALAYLKQKGGLELVTKPEVVESFNFQGENANIWKKLILQIDRFIPCAKFNSTQIFNLLFEAGKIIPGLDNHRALEIVVTERILFLLGVGPFLEKCLVCGTNNNLYFFSGNLGGLVCSKCQAREPTSFKLPEKHIEALRFLHKIPIGHIPVVKYIPEGLYLNLTKCINEIVRYHMAD
ncbi:MAG: DNA repair protein RecO [Candidatus Omnitrophica bacterium]|nr:DNA repair protein RecO [Candidatus Omnitrophota bacterium]MCM8828467.1 DNA repair protein RecO [Candidatus Omnitrophota bacterium]